MTDAAVHHSTFVIERDLAASPARVWGAFADQDLKSRWFGADTDSYEVTTREFDFSPGGVERMVGHWKNGRISDFQCRYYDILEGQRITYVYEMFVDGRKLSVSLASIEIAPSAKGAKLTITEQGAYFGADGAKDAAGREAGTNFIIDMLTGSLD